MPKDNDYKKIKNQNPPAIDPVAECFKAAKDGNLETLKIYIKSNRVDKDTLDPIAHIGLLHSAAYEGHLEVVNYLIEKKADINLRSKGGNWRANSTPLHLAISGRKVEVVRVLLANHADTNLRNDAGMAAMHFLENRHQHNVNEKAIREITQLLIDHSADLTLKLYSKDVIEFLTGSSYPNFIAAEVVDAHLREKQFEENTLLRTVRELTDEVKKLKLELSEVKAHRKEKKERKASAFTLLPPPTPRP